MKTELMKKAAVTIRSLGNENAELKAKVEELSKTASELSDFEKTASAAKAVVTLVAEGEIDPEDALEKFAEVSSLNAEEIKLVLGKCEASVMGHVKSASVGGSSNPLTDYLLGI